MSAPALSSSRLVAALAVLVRFAARVQKAQERRRIVYSLASLDDHMLRDIGLNRCDVDSVMAEPVLTDGTLLLAERVMDGRRHQRALGSGGAELGQADLRSLNAGRRLAGAYILTNDE